MQFSGMSKPPLGVIFDCDMGNRIDTALALSLLYGLDGKNECRVICVTTSMHNLKSAAFCETVGRFYSGAVAGGGGFPSFGRSLPVGMSVEGKVQPETPMLAATLDRKNPDGTPVYQHGIHKLTDTAETPALIRNAFTSQQDQNCVVVLAGPATNLAQVLRLPDVKDWITRKVKYLVVSGGTFPDGPAEAHIKADVAAAKRLVAEWPSPIVVAGQEIGAKLLYPAASIEKDFAWSKAHPVVDAYRAFKPMPYDAPTWDMAAVLHAVRPTQGFFKLSEPGRISVGDDGRTKFTAAADGKHQYLILDPAQQEKIVQTYTELVSAKPVERTPFRFRQQQKKAATPPKASETKPQN
jgi:inosine-uridine nucleoside N-ribohydrolase